MGVLPIDMQVMIPKAVDVAKQQSSDNHMINAGQQNINTKETERQDENTKRVYDRDKAEKIYVDEEEKEEKEKEKERKKSNNKSESDEGEEDKKEEIKPDFVGGHFDASV